MYRKSDIIQSNSSTPKRRRLGTGVIITQKCIKENFKSNHSNPTIFERCESPILPCNQMEYLSDSHTTSPSSYDSFLVQEKIETCDISNRKTADGARNQSKIFNHLNYELDDVSDEMFHTKLELELSQINTQNKLEKPNLSVIKLEEDINNCFELVNQSICSMQNNEINNKSHIFETQDSFLLELKETCDLVKESNQNKVLNRINIKKNELPGFYGLPMITKGIFKSYRNIEVFYDWQEECLNLDANKQRRNLIYALPTSGGKTLVAEVLMLREVLNRKKNALFILPFVAIVQEKIWALSPFALQLEFLVEEYAAGKGYIPPKKRRKKNSIYIATIEKGLALIRSLVEANRLDELGIIVIDELHLIGEPGRGRTLETLLTTVTFANRDIQIVGMSATIGNLPQLASYMKADVFERNFRPVELKEYVKLGDMMHQLTWIDSKVELTPSRQLKYDYSPAGLALDPDRLGGLVGELPPSDGCLVFCPTQKNAENVAELLCRLQRKEMAGHRVKERQALAEALRLEGACGLLRRVSSRGVAWHHAGLAGPERTLLEQAFRSGVISILCCTSTLAAGVNLPAKRVIIRAPRVGRVPLTLANYRQMAGRAGRADLADTGESILICTPYDWPQMREVLSAGVSPARSSLTHDDNAGVKGLLLSGIALNLAITRNDLQRMMKSTLLAVAGSFESTEIDIRDACDVALHSLMLEGAIELAAKKQNPTNCKQTKLDLNEIGQDCHLVVSNLGNAAIKGCMDLTTAKNLIKDLTILSKNLVLMGMLHLLYLVTPQEPTVKPHYTHYYSLYCSLDEEGLKTAKVLGITEMNAVRMMTGKPITNVPESVLRRFFLALMLRDLCQEISLSDVAEKYCVSRGFLQSLMSTSSSFAVCASRVTAELGQFHLFSGLLSELSAKMQAAGCGELKDLMQLPGVKQGRARQLIRAGYKRIEDIAKLSAETLVENIEHMSKTAANLLISSARVMLIEKVENLRAEAEDIMEDLKKS